MSENPQRPPQQSTSTTYTTDDESVTGPPVEQTRRPKDTALRQQRLKSWQPILHPVWVICTFFIFGIIFLPVGLKIGSMSDDVHEYSKKYDDYTADIEDDNLCVITKANQGRECEVKIEITGGDMKPPIFVHYEIEGFHQNHRRYETSRDDAQLLGSLTQTSLSADQCSPLNKLGDIFINPCGLIANTFFNDVISLSPVDAADNKSLAMIETGIAWKSDIDYAFAQPDGFKYEQCPNNDCNSTCCEGDDWSCTEPYEEDEKCYRYYYPNDDTTQYLYETYNGTISPLEGVTNEHFIVWMKVAALPRFRKLYGWFDQPIKNGTTLIFNVTANWEVRSFEGKKTIVVSDSNMFGGKNNFLGPFFVIVGAVLLGVGGVFALKHAIRPRKIADKKYLVYKED